MSLPGSWPRESSEEPDGHNVDLFDPDELVGKNSDTNSELDFEVPKKGVKKENESNRSTESIVQLTVKTSDVTKILIKPSKTKNANDTFTTVRQSNEIALQSELIRIQAEKITVMEQKLSQARKINLELLKANNDNLEQIITMTVEASKLHRKINQLTDDLDEENMVAFDIEIEGMEDHCPLLKQRTQTRFEVEKRLLLPLPAQNGRLIGHKRGYYGEDTCDASGIRAKRSKPL